MELTEPEVAWLAGLLEGEGSFFVQKRPDPRRDQARVYLAMTDEDVVRRAAAMMGVPAGIRRKRHEGWQDQWTAVATSGKAAQIMRLVLPYLGKRRSARVREILALPLSHTAVE